jgi:hypothetical protein
MEQLAFLDASASLMPAQVRLFPILRQLAIIRIACTVLSFSFTSIGFELDAHSIPTAELTHILKMILPVMPDKL